MIWYSPYLLKKCFANKNKKYCKKKLKKVLTPGISFAIIYFAAGKKRLFITQYNEQI